MKKYLIASAVFFMFFVGPSFVGATSVPIQCSNGEKAENVEVAAEIPATYSCVDTETWGGWNEDCSNLHQDNGNENSNPPPFKYTKQELTPAVPAVYEWRCVPQTATISSTKIVCDNESDLPNWGAGDVMTQITSNTASRFLSLPGKSDNCREVPWVFEWSADGIGNPGDNVGAGGSGWNTFTNIATIPAGAKVWVREQMDSNYIPFTGANTDQPISAEFYCSTDVLNYDN